MRLLVFDQSSPVQPVSEPRGGGSPERDGRRKEDILVSNIGFVISQAKESEDEQRSVLVSARPPLKIC